MKLGDDLESTRFIYLTTNSSWLYDDFSRSEKVT